jgi:hypothetical protein
VVTFLLLTLISIGAPLVSRWRARLRANRAAAESSA